MDQQLPAGVLALLWENPAIRETREKNGGKLTDVAHYITALNGSPIAFSNMCKVLKPGFFDFFPHLIEPIINRINLTDCIHKHVQREFNYLPQNVRLNTLGTEMTMTPTEQCVTLAVLAKQMSRGANRGAAHPTTAAELEPYTHLMWLASHNELDDTQRAEVVKHMHKNGHTAALRIMAKMTTFASEVHMQIDPVVPYTPPCQRVITGTNNCTGASNIISGTHCVIPPNTGNIISGTCNTTGTGNISVLGVTNMGGEPIRIVLAGGSSNTYIGANNTGMINPVALPEVNRWLNVTCFECGTCVVPK